ncbi:MAG: radical SAM protein [Euryarchaeota archaeon]|nr:radical SAM protein [Euryarchaeota archaeon]
MCAWLVIDGYEDEPAAFGVPNYVGFHIRYICGVLEKREIEYTYITIDQWRISRRKDLNQNSVILPDLDFNSLDGVVILAGAVVPGKYVRGTPVSKNEIDSILSEIPSETPILCGGWAIRQWRYSGWSPLRINLFCTVQDVDATLNLFLDKGVWKNMKRTPDQWSSWALEGAKSKAVSHHPDLFFQDGSPGPLTYELELYQGCVRFKRGCKFCIEPKKGLPIWRSEEDVIREVNFALDLGVRNVRIGGATDIYTFRAEGVEELDYPIPQPEPISRVLHGLRDDDRLDILHVDNANPSIIAENLEPSEEITKTLVETLSDGAILSFGIESADEVVHSRNWLNCDIEQLRSAVKLVNKFGREKGDRGLPHLLPGLNFIAGLNGETEKTYSKNLDLLRSLRKDGLWLRRINIRQVEGNSFQEVNTKQFKKFKNTVREEIDRPTLEEIFPIGSKLRDVFWEAHNDRIRRPEQVTEYIHRDSDIYGSPGITFGRQIGAYPILVGVPYRIQLERKSDIMVTGHGSRSITGVEMELNINKVSERQLEAIPGVGKKSSWKIVSNRAKIRSTSPSIPFSSVREAFEAVDLEVPHYAEEVLVAL